MKIIKQSHHRNGITGSPFKIGIIEDDDKSRKLMFATNNEDLSIIRVRAFDVATFVAFGAAHIGVAGDDIINEFDYEEVYDVLDLKIGKCRLSIAKTKD